MENNPSDPILALAKNGRPLTPEEISNVRFTCPVLALPIGKAAEALGVSRQTIARQIARGNLRKTSYGVIPVAELQRHLAAEVEKRK